MNIQEFLGRRNIPFDVVKHAETHDAQRMAHAVHVSGHQVAKTVLLRLVDPGVEGEQEFVVAVLPATHSIDFEKAGKVLGAKKVGLATETEMAQRCRDCDVGVLPPFGSQYGMRTVVDESFAEEDQIVFEGRVHSEAIRMKYADFVALESPSVANLSN